MDRRTPAAKKANYVGGRPKDESKLSTKPAQVRIRLRRAAKNNLLRDGRIARDMEMLYQKPIDEWDLEELAHGRPRSKDGSFRGKTPSWCTSAVQQEAKKRLLNTAFGTLAGHIDIAVKAIADLINSTEVDDNGKPIVDARTKLAASIFVIENIIGKPKAVVEVQANEFTKQAIAAAIVLDDGMPEDHFILDGEVVEDEDGEEEDVATDD